jgi:hypothetical protein
MEKAAEAQQRAVEPSQTQNDECTERLQNVYALECTKYLLK